MFIMFCICINKLVHVKKIFFIGEKDFFFQLYQLTFIHGFVVKTPENRLKSTDFSIFRLFSPYFGLIE